MNVNEAIKKRRSIRRYKETEMVPDNDIKQILTAAMLAPSACNSRPWNFIVLKSPQSKEKAVSIHPYAHQLSYASIGIIVCASPELQSGIAQGYYPQDCAAAIENMLLQATELNYGSCWCGIYPQEERMKLFKETFEIEDMPIALVVIGVSDQEPEARGFFEESKVRII